MCSGCALCSWLRLVALTGLVQVAGYCEKVAALQDRRTGLYHSLEEALLKLKANKDVQSFQNTLKRIGG